MSKRIAIVGAGTMGSVLQSVWQSDNSVTMITRESYPDTNWSEFEMVCFAIKPQDFKLLNNLQLPTQVIISIMAGISLAALQAKTGSNQIIRCMPNTPMQVHQGMTAWCATSAVTSELKQWFRTSLQSVTALLEVPNDEWLNKATAVSASGPGFLFAILEQYTAATEALGFSPADAKQLVTQTMLGSAKLIEKSGKSVGELRTAVTSKGGTTAAGLAALQMNWEAVLMAAYQRAEELSQ